MNREDIYDHLAQVYLGKRKEVDTKKKKQFNAWLVINILIAFVIFASATYGLTAFLAQKRTDFNSSILFSLHNGPVTFEYNFQNSLHPTESFSLSIPAIEIAKYKSLQFAVRAREEGSPGILKVVFRNKRNETSSYYIQGIILKWKNFNIPLEEFREITDWSTIEDVSFILETWNVEKKKGLILIDNIYFAS